MNTLTKTNRFSVVAKIFGTILVVGAVGFGASMYSKPLLDSLRGANQDANKAAPIMLGLAHESLAALAIIANNKQYFSEQGVDVEVKNYASGKLALNAFLDGEVDLATTADIPIVFKSMKRRDFKIVSTIGSSDNEPRIIALKNAGINKPEDLRGKRVATQKASAVHFFLHVFLLKNGMDASDVDLSYMKGKKLPAALAAKEIDAFSMREPFIGEATELLGEDNVVVFTAPGLYRKTFNLIASKSIIRHKSEHVEKIVKALAQAEAFAIQNEGEAVTIVAQALGSKPEKIAAIWKDVSLKVSLDQSLLLGLEGEANWVLDNKFSDAEKAPVYLDYMYIDALKSVNPVMVSLIH